MTEKRLWQWLRRPFACNADYDIRRVENGVGNGFPDVNGMSIEHGEFWIELKAHGAPKRETSLLLCEPLKDTQVRWMKRRMRLGAKVAVLYQAGEERFVADGRTAVAMFAPRPRIVDLRTYAVKVEHPLDVLDAAFGDPHLRPARLVPMKII